MRFKDVISSQSKRSTVSVSFRDPKESPRRRSIAPQKYLKPSNFANFLNVPATARLRSASSVNQALAGCRPRCQHAVSFVSIGDDRIGKVAGLRSNSRLATDSRNDGADAFARMSGDVYQPGNSVSCSADFAGGAGAAGGNSDGSAISIGLPPGHGKE